MSKTAGAAAPVLFVALLMGLPVVELATESMLWKIVADIYRAGALVFGGGHVVLFRAEAHTSVPRRRCKLRSIRPMG